MIDHLLQWSDWTFKSQYDHTYDVIFDIIWPLTQIRQHTRKRTHTHICTREHHQHTHIRTPPAHIRWYDVIHLTLYLTLYDLLWSHKGPSQIKRVHLISKGSISDQKGPSQIKRVHLRSKGSISDQKDHLRSKAPSQIKRTISDQKGSNTRIRVFGWHLDCISCITGYIFSYFTLSFVFLPLSSNPDNGDTYFAVSILIEG